jgi:hypothetical protein
MMQGDETTESQASTQPEYTNSSDQSTQPSAGTPNNKPYPTTICWTWNVGGESQPQGSSEERKEVTFVSQQIAAFP